MTLEQQLIEAERRGDKDTVKRIKSAIEKMDNYRMAYGRQQRGEVKFKNGIKVYE